jgi:hypothetical protein
MGDLAGATAFLVGTRGAAVANERGVRPAWTAPMATYVGGIPTAANRLAEALYESIATATVTQLTSSSHVHAPERVSKLTATRSYPSISAGSCARFKISHH